VDYARSRLRTIEEANELLQALFTRMHSARLPADGNRGLLDPLSCYHAIHPILHLQTYISIKRLDSIRKRRLLLNLHNSHRRRQDRQGKLMKGEVRSNKTSHEILSHCWRSTIAAFNTGCILFVARRIICVSQTLEVDKHCGHRHGEVPSLSRRSKAFEPFCLKR